MICDSCLHANVCGIEGSFEEAMTYCADFLYCVSVSNRLPKVVDDKLLDKIRAEIEEHAIINQNLNIDRANALCWCLDVIDKYRESEK